MKLALCVALPLVVALIPSSWVESGPPLCLFRRLFGVRCPGCGMTRAVSCLAHGQPRRAVRHNWRVVIVFPILVTVWLRTLAGAARDCLRCRMRSIIGEGGEASSGL